MKKVTLLGVILLLLAFSVAPVLAAGNGHGNGQGNGQGNGHGVGVSAGQSNNGGISDQTKTRDQDRDRDQIRLGFPGRGGNRGAAGIQNSMRMRTPFYLQGTITAIEGTGTATETLTISLTHGNAQIKQFFTTGMTVTVDNSTQIFELTQGDESTESTEQNTSSTMDEDTGNRVPVSMDRLAVDQRVAIHGNVVDGVFHARLITIYIGMPLGETVETP